MIHSGLLLVCCCLLVINLAEASSSTGSSTPTKASVCSNSTTPTTASVSSEDSPCTVMTELNLDDLPRWELNNRFGFPSPFDEAVDKYVEETGKMAKEFQADYEGKLSEVSLRKVIEEFEAIALRRNKISCYLSLHYDTQLDNDNLKKRKGAISQTQSQVYGDHLEWFSLDLSKMSEQDLADHHAKDPSLKDYNPYIEEERRFRLHNLAKDVERALTVRSAWYGTRGTVSFFDKELTLMRFQLKDGEDKVNIEALLSQLSSSKEAAIREKCLKELNDGLGGVMGRVAALSLSTVCGKWHIENQERGYKNLRSQRNLGNNCPDEAVDSLLLGVRTAGVPLCKRYYSLKKSVLKQTQGLEKFQWSDRNAPIDIEGSGKEDEKISWEKCVEIVETGYRSFSPRMADMFLKFVEEKRIDVPQVDGKKGGAYCSATVPGVGPFQLLNYAGTKNDVATTAHESGHAVHDQLAYAQNKYIQAHPPLTLAETASIFGEMIVFRKLLQMADSKAERLTLLMSKIDDTINSVVRQCSFDRFEELAHTARKDGELNAEELDKYWMQAVEEYYGKLGDDDAPFDNYDNVDHLWAYVPHFHHVPFYVYSYAFADLVVGTLYHSFQTNPDGFEDRLLGLLSAGGTLDFATALAPFGLDPKSPSFWEDAIKAHLGGLMAEAEALAAELGYVQAA